MPVTYLNSSTLSEALTTTSTKFNVGSTANITVGNYLAIRGTAGLEMVKVTAIPVSGQVTVNRGVNGTRAVAHASGTLFFIGSPEKFKTIPGSSPSEFIALDATQGNFPQWALPGTRARDGAGNEYIMVDCTASIITGVTVLISKDGNFTASVLTSTGVGDVGILVEDATSDQWAWAIIKGYYSRAKLAIGSSLCTSLGEFGGASTASSGTNPAVGLLGRSSSQRSSDWLSSDQILGMFPASAATTATTGATSETGLSIAVWLNYPWHQRAITS